MTLRLLLVAADVVTAAIVFLLVSLVRFGDGESSEFWGRLGIDIRLAAVAFGIVWVSALWFTGLYKLRVRWRLATEARDLIRTTALVVLVTLSGLFVLRQTEVSRLFLLMLFTAQPLVTLAGRSLLRYVFGSLRRRGMNTRYMLIAGTGVLAQGFADRVERQATLGIRVIGHLSVPGESEHRVTRRVLGSVADIEAIFHARIVDEVGVCLPPGAGRWLDPIASLAADEGKTVRIPELVEETLPVGHQEEFDGFLVRSLVHDSQRELGLVAKRLIDIGGAAFGLAVLSPILFGIALVLRLTQRSPVLFKQQRGGLQGRPFTIYKFRTMVLDAEARQEEVAHLNTRQGPAFKADNDPRITRHGSFLRRTSLDELPQLWNVLRGEMSLVGPRPQPLHEVDRYDVWHRRRLSMKPGITGLWQVELRDESDFDRWVERDLTYIDRWSLRLDLKILALTIPAVFVRSGK